MVNGGVKFCTLGVEHCSYSTHSKKVQVLPNHIYIKAGPKAAFTYHKIPAAQFSVDQLHQFLGETRPLDAWAALFSSINGQQASAVIQSVATPAKKRKQCYATEDEDSEGLGFELRELFDFLASLRTNSQDFETIMSPSVLMKFFDSTVMILQKMTAHSDSLSFHVGEDLDTVSQQYSSLMGVVGSKPRQLESSTADLLSGPTLWEGLQALVAALETNQQYSHEISQQVQELTQLTNSLQTSQTNMEAATAAARQQLVGVTSNLRDIMDFLHVLNQEHQAFLSGIQSMGDLGAMANTCQQLTMRLQALESHSGSPFPSAQLSALTSKLQSIEAQLGVNPVRLVDIIFNSLEDVRLFVENHASGLSFSLFHDAVTLLESLTDIYAEHQDISWNGIKPVEWGSRRWKPNMSLPSSSFYPQS